MAAPIVTGTKTDASDSCCENVRAEHNNLVTKFEALLAKLDADAGVTSTDYVATIGGVAGIVKDRSGN